MEECIAAGSNFRALPIDLPTGEERSAVSLRDAGWEERIVGHLDASSELVDLLAKLPVRLRNVLVMRFVEERKQSDIAGEIGVSQVHVSRLIKQALVALATSATERSSTPDRFCPSEPFVVRRFRRTERFRTS